jgi:hypothetical protein
VTPGSNYVAPLAPTLIEPSASLPRANGCDEITAVALISAFFAALNTGDQAAIEALIAPDGQFDIEISPDIVNASLRNGKPISDAPSVDARSRSQLASIMTATLGMHFVFTAQLAGGIYIDSNPGSQGISRFGIGPILWRATGPSLAQKRWVDVVGGGKAAVDCPSVRIIRILIGPIEYHTVQR